MTSTEAIPSQLIDLNSIAWADMLPGVQGKRVWADKATNRVAMFIRFAPGASLPRHAHEGDELVYVLEGCVADDYGELTAGCVGYRPNGCTHTVRSPSGATAFAVVTGGSAPRNDSDTGGPASQVFDLPHLAWQSGALVGIHQKPFWSDEAAGRRAMCNRFEPGASLPPHRHNGDELVFVIEGSIADESGALRPGVVGYRPNGCAHSVTSPTGATVLAFLWGGVEPLG